MRTPSTGLATELANPVTTPGFLVEVLFATPLRLSSRGTLTWSGNSWTTWGVDVRGLGFDLQSSNQPGSLILNDTDNTITALVNGQGIADRTINIWAFYGSPTAADPVQIFAGVGDAAQWSPDGSSVTVMLEQRGAATQFCPRLYMTAANGFNHLPGSGTVVPWNGESFVLEPG